MKRKRYMRDEMVEALTAIIPYADHLPICRRFVPQPPDVRCTCGLVEVLDRVSRAKP